MDHDEQAGGVDEAILATAARHALHDEELIAAYADGGLEADEADEADEAERARSLVERCPACRELHADLVAVQGATHAMAGFTARAPRDFRLPVEGEAKAASGSVLRRLARRVANALAALGRPAGMALAALGLVGLLVVPPA